MKLPWRPVRGILIGLAVAVAVLGWAVFHGAPYLAPLLAVVAFALVSMVSTQLRARTAIEADGIRNRTLFRETFVRWDELDDVLGGVQGMNRTVKVRTRDGRVISLWALGDSAVVRRPDFAATIELIRDHLPPPSDAGPEPGPVTFRPSRWPLVYLVPLLAAAGYVLIRADNGLVVGRMLLGLIVLGWLWYLLVILTGRTYVDADGVRNREVGKETFVPWDEIDRVAVQGSLFGRHVSLRTTGGKTVAPAAPRMGLLASGRGFDEALRAFTYRIPLGAVLSRAASWTAYAVIFAVLLSVTLPLDKPWLSPWWPGRHEATATPHACDLRPGGITHGPACEWEIPGGHLRVTYTRYRRLMSSSGTGQARHYYRDGIDPDPVPIGGLGDEARRSVMAGSVLITARRANVVVRVDYSSRDAVGQKIATAERIARDAVARVRV